MREAEITSYAVTKINKNEPVSLEVLMRICQVFHCDIRDICEVILDKQRKVDFTGTKEELFICLIMEMQMKLKKKQ